MSGAFAGTAGTTLSIIATVFIILFGLIFFLVLFFMNKGLKALNRGFKGAGGDVTKQFGESIEGMDAAQDQLEELSVLTDAAKVGVRSAIGFAEHVVAFLRSDAFQVGLPVAIWVGWLVVAVPRVLVFGRTRRKRIVFEPVPPPSWEEEEDLD